MKPLKSLCIATVAMSLTACATSTPPSVSPLVQAMCPPLTPLDDPSFGATTRKLVEVAGIYHRCRTAAGVK